MPTLMSETKDSRKVEATRLSIEKYKEHLQNIQLQNEGTQRLIEPTQHSDNHTDCQIDPLNETSIEVNVKMSPRRISTIQQKTLLKPQLSMKPQVFSLLSHQDDGNLTNQEEHQA